MNIFEYPIYDEYSYIKNVRITSIFLGSIHSSVLELHGLNLYCLSGTAVQ